MCNCNGQGNCNCGEEKREYALEKCETCAHAGVCMYAVMLLELMEVSPIDPYKADCEDYLIDSTLYVDEGDEEEQVGDCTNCIGEPKGIITHPGMAALLSQIPYFFTPEFVRNVKEPVLANALVSSTAQLIEHGYVPVGVFMNSATSKKLLDEIGIQPVGVGDKLQRINLPMCALWVEINEAVPDNNFQISCSR